MVKLIFDSSINILETMENNDQNIIRYQNRCVSIKVNTTTCTFSYLYSLILCYRTNTILYTAL